MTTTASTLTDSPQGADEHESLSTADVSPHRRLRTRRAATAAYLLVFSTAVAVVFWPGRMSADTFAQIGQLRSGDYSDWHAPVLLLMWRPFWLLGVGPGWVMWAAVLTFVGGLYGVLRCRFQPRGAALAASAITLLPQVLGYVGYLGRDMWFTAALLAACAALVLQTRTARPAQFYAGGVAFLAVWLMLAARQNAILAAAVLVFATITYCWPSSSSSAWLRRAEGRGRLRSVLLRGAVAFVVLMLMIGSQALVRRVFGVESTHFEQALFIYDLASLSHEEGVVLLDPEFFPSQDLAVIDQSYNENPNPLEPLIFGPDPPFVYPVPDDRVEELRSDWLRAIREYPSSYVEERFELWLDQLSLTGPTLWVFHPRIDANSWGYEASFPTLDNAANDYLRFFAANDSLEGGPVHELWFYGLVTLAGLAYVASRRRERQVLGWICLASLTNQMSFLPTAMGAGYRWGFPAVVIALAVAAMALADLATWANERFGRSRQPQRAESSGGVA